MLVFIHTLFLTPELCEIIGIFIETEHYVFVLLHTWRNSEASPSE